MSSAREEIKRHVRELLARELQASSPATGPAAASSLTHRNVETDLHTGSAAMHAAVRGTILTERDVEDAVRSSSGRVPVFPPGTRFTPLAEEVLERHRRTAEYEQRDHKQKQAKGRSEPAIREQSAHPAVSSSPSESTAAPRPASSSAFVVTPSNRAGAHDTVAIGADHGGFELKELLAGHLREQGYRVVDCGTHSKDSCDYPVFARAVAEQVRTGAAAAGVIVDGAGIGSAMTANKVPGVRAAHCQNVVEARNAREHNHAHVLTLGAGIIGPTMAREVMDAFLVTPFGEGRHARRVALIEPSTLPSATGKLVR